MKEIKEKVQALADKYSPELAKYGLKLLISKHYFETKVSERSTASNKGAILSQIEIARDRKTEKQKYHYQRNRYHTIVITLIPDGKNVLPQESCRDYAFLLRGVERSHIGKEPRQIIYEEEKIMLKIEKRILKILKKAERMPPQKLCKDNIFDAIRYMANKKYGYKRRFLGKERSTWDLISGIFVLAFALIFILTVWLINK